MNDPDNLTDEEMAALVNAFNCGFTGENLVIDDETPDEDKDILMTMRWAGRVYRRIVIQTSSEFARRMKDRGL